MRIETLFFDVGNTLLFPDAGCILRPLHERGVFPSAELLHSIERRTKRSFDSLIEAHPSVDHGFWRMYYSDLLKELDVQDDALRDELVLCARMSANWRQVRPGTREILLEFRNRYRLGVISNSDGKIAQVLARCGIADCFETITDSGIVGAEKPDPAIFRAAMDSLGASAPESLYVGDVYSVDYLGASRAGMQAILFDAAGTYAQTEFPRIESLEELKRLLL